MKGAHTLEKMKKYILVMDANAVDRFSTCLLLQRFGYYIVTASTPEEAVEFMNMARPSAVVADVGLAGSPLFSGVKKDRRFSAIPLILLSSSDEALEEYRTKGSAIAAYLRKPVHVEEFYQTLQTIVEKGSRRNIRIPTHITAALEDGPVAGGGYVSELSEEGMFFQSLESRPMNARIPISFEIMGRTILLEAVVLYCASLEQGLLKKPGMGMKFEKISPVDRDLIKTYILDHVKEGMSRQRYYNC